MHTINVVLVKSIYPTNIGASARALANMGGDRLILIDPQCEVNSKARQGAAGAQSSFNRIVQYKNWDEFYKTEGNGLRIGLTARQGKQRKTWPMKELIASEFKNVTQETPIYLIFGPEDNGLSAEDLAYVNFAASLPTYGEFKSINLSHSVILALFVLRDGLGAIHRAKKPKKKRAEIEPMVFPDESIKKWLTAMGFDISARRASAYLTMRKVLLRNCPTTNELMVLEAVLQQNIRKLTDQKEKLT